MSSISSSPRPALLQAVSDHHVGPPEETAAMKASSRACYPGSPVAFAASELYRLLVVGASGPGLSHCLEVELPEAILLKLQVRGEVAQFAILLEK